ncbi:MAG: MerR family transcriptional regulator [Clostridia bacterium]|nr:MerR family transcriptional regulator [Clostridia bacterium]
MNRKDYYSIGEVASMCNISIRTLRYYDEIGLVVPEIRKEDSKYRYYSDSQMLNVIIIRKLRTLGIGLKSIKKIIEQNDLDIITENVSRRVDELRKEIEELEWTCKRVDATLDRLRLGMDIYKKNAVSRVSEDIKIEKIPKISIYYSRKIMQSYHNEKVSMERWVGLEDEIAENELRVCGPIIVTYHTELLDQFFSKTCDIEFGVHIETCDSENVRTFGGFDAVTVYHVGSYSDIIKTYVKAIQWINQNNYRVNGSVSEEFIVSPIDVNDEKEHITKIIIPVEKETTKKA